MELKLSGILKSVTGIYQNETNWISQSSKVVALVYLRYSAVYLGASYP